MFYHMHPLAAFTALFTSAWLASATSDNFSSVAGFMVAKYFLLWKAFQIFR
jgi:hypothetical protein